MQEIVEIIGPTGSGKTAHLKALADHGPFVVETRHRVREHVFMLVKSISVWIFLQAKCRFLDSTLLFLRRLCVYHAALKTVESGARKSSDKRKGDKKLLREVHLVDEGIFHILLMHKFVSLKEQAAWDFFARQQICKLAGDKTIVVFALTVSHDRRRERLRIRNEIESERLRVANHGRGGTFGPLGVEFIRSLECEAAGRMKVVMLDNNGEGEHSIAANVAMIQTVLKTREEVLGPVGSPAGIKGVCSGKHGAL